MTEKTFFRELRKQQSKNIIVIILITKHAKAIARGKRTSRTSILIVVATSAAVKIVSH
jgi:hypothetical protein